MATKYLDSTATGTGDGSSWTNAYTTFAAAYSGASAGSTIEVSGGTYAVGAVSGTKSMTIKGSTESGHDGWFKLDSSGTANFGFRPQDAAAITFERVWFSNAAANQHTLLVFTASNITLIDCIYSSELGRGPLLHQSFAGTFHAIRTKFLETASSTFWRQSTGSAYTEIYDACIFDGGPPGAFQQTITAGTSTRVWNNCIFGCSNSTSLISVNASVGNSTMNNCIIMPIGLDVSAPQQIADANGSPTITAYNSLFMENWFDVIATNNEVADGGNNIGLTEGESVLVKWATPRRSCASISVMIDDYLQAVGDDGETFASLCEARGVRASFCVQAKSVTDSGAAILAGLINRGHSVSLHGATGAGLKAANHPALAITGPNPSTVAIANNTMTFTGTGQLGPITLDETTTIGALATTINAWTGWTCTSNPGTATNSSATVGANLEDVGATDSYNGGSGITLNLDEDKFNTYELVTGKALLEAAIQEHIPGWTCTTQVYSLGFVDAASELVASTAGFLAARGSNDQQGLWGWVGATTGYRPFRSYAVLIDPSVYTDADSGRRASSLAETIKWVGGIWCLYNHNLTGTSPSNPPTTATQWGLIVDQLVASGISIQTYDEQAALMRTGATPMNGDLEYTRDFRAEDIAWVPQLLPTSQLIGVGKKTWTGPEPVGLDGEPFSDMDTDIGPIQSTVSPLHPVNL